MIMPIDKNIEKRIRFLDEIFQRGRYTKEELLSALEEHFNGDMSISQRTLENDLKRINDRTNNLQKIRDGRVFLYSYEDKTKTYFDQMDENVSMALRGMMSYMSGLQGFKQFKELQECVYDICNKYDINIDDPIFSFENTDRLYNDIILNKNLNNLHRFIENEQIVSIKMTSFNWDDDSLIKEYIIHPYHLKEYNNRWYLIGYCEDDERKDKTVLPVDRMKHIVERDGEYREPTEDVDYSKIFDDRIGVGDGPIVNLVIKVRSQLRYKYLMSKHMHRSQRELGEQDGCHLLGFKLVNNKELHQQLRSYGDEIEVMEPQTLRDSIAKSIMRMNELYNK
jgi:hypothetical protein